MRNLKKKKALVPEKLDQISTVPGFGPGGTILQIDGDRRQNADDRLVVICHSETFPFGGNCLQVPS